MKILVIGDPHGRLDKIKKIPLKKVDLILLTGDLGSSDLMRKMAFENIERAKEGLQKKEYSANQEKKAFMESYNSSIKLVKYLSRFSSVYAIFGNVESSNYETRKLSKRIGTNLPSLSNDLNSLDNVMVINNKIANFNRVRIGGLEYFVDMGWVRNFKPPEFKKRIKEAKKETGKAKKVLSNFDYLDILLCHQPPYGILDKVTAKYAPKDWKGKNAGSKTILDYIKRKKPRYVFCGHIHEGKGKKKIGKTTVINVGANGDYFVLNLKGKI